MADILLGLDFWKMAQVCNFASVHNHSGFKIQSRFLKIKIGVKLKCTPTANCKSNLEAKTWNILQSPNTPNKCTLNEAGVEKCCFFFRVTNREQEKQI